MSQPVLSITGPPLGVRHGDDRDDVIRPRVNHAVWVAVELAVLTRTKHAAKSRGIADDFLQRFVKLARESNCRAVTSLSVPIEGFVEVAIGAAEKLNR